MSGGFDVETIVAFGEAVKCGQSWLKGFDLSQFKEAVGASAFDWESLAQLVRALPVDCKKAWTEPAESDGFRGVIAQFCCSTNGDDGGQNEAIALTIMCILAEGNTGLELVSKSDKLNAFLNETVREWIDEYDRAIRRGGGEPSRVAMDEGISANTVSSLRTLVDNLSQRLAKVEDALDKELPALRSAVKELSTEVRQLRAGLKEIDLQAKNFGSFFEAASNVARTLRPANTSCAEDDA